MKNKEIQVAQVLKDAVIATKLEMKEHQQLGQHMRVSAALILGQFGKTLSKALLGHVANLDRRIAELERQAAIDDELINELANMAKRLEQVEDRSWTHRGYWRDGVQAKRNEVYSHNGSSWICQRSTADSPCVESDSWTRLARAGRDGRDAR